MEITSSCNESKTTSVSQPYSKQSSVKTSESKVSAENSILHHSQHQSQPPPPPTLPSQPPLQSAPTTQQQQQTSFSVYSSNATTNSSDLKYLHKKFKRIASATPNSDSGSESKLVTSVAAGANSSFFSTTSAGGSSTITITASAYGFPAERLPNSQSTVLSYEPVQRLQQQQQQQQQSQTTACANEGDLVHSYRPNTDRIRPGQPTVDECYSRPQLTSLSSEHSNGASLNRANNISRSNSFISNNHISRENEESHVSYYPIVNNNSAINTSCDLNEKTQCSLSNNSTNSSATLSTPKTTTASVDSVGYENCSQLPVTGELLSVVPSDTALCLASAAAANPINTATPGRYVCPFCQMLCSKPSVLQKHIRRHTNERPFRCDPCGIAFKTKSNLYKHCRSRAHASKSQGEDIGPVIDEDGSLGGSDIEDKELSNSGSEISLLQITRGSPMDDRMHSPQLLVEKPYKPKFHNAALYAKFDAKLANKLPSSTPSSTSSSTTNLNVSHSAPPTPHYFNGQNVESLEQHISKLISDNEAIVEVVEPPLQKKYHKITGITRGISVSGSSNPAHPGQDSGSGSNSSKLASALLQKRNSEELLQLPAVQLYANTAPSEHNVITVSNKPIVTGKSAVAVVNQAVPYGAQTHHAVQMVVRVPNGNEQQPVQHHQLQVQYQQPLNLCKPVPNEPVVVEMELPRKRSSGTLYSREQSPSSSVQYSSQQTNVVPQPVPVAPQQVQPHPSQQQQQQQVTVTDHPQNPERSIIKDLLLNSRGFGVVQNPENENMENLFTCKSCNISFRNAEILKYHTICYCQGNASNLNSPSSSAPISPVGSPSSYLMRSKSYNPTSLKTLARVSLNPPPRNPSTLSKLAKSQLRLPRSRPEHISLLSDVAGPNPTIANSNPPSLDTPIPTIAKIVDVVQNPLPSPGPLLGNTRLVDFQSNKAEGFGRSAPAESTDNALHPPPAHKRALVVTGDDHHLSLRTVQHPSLQLFGGNVEIIHRNGEIPSHRYTSGGTVTRFSPDVDSEMHDYGMSGRSNSMHSGGTFLQLPESNRSSSPVIIKNPATPKLVVTITPTLSSAAMTTQNFYPNQQQLPVEVTNPAAGQPITRFQFPPINPITAYNPLTLPQSAPGQAAQIMHGGKLIPFVQGMPGPNSVAMQSEPKCSPRISASPNPIMQSISISTGNHLVVGPTVKLQSPSLLTVVKPTNTTATDRRFETGEEQQLLVGRSKKPFSLVAPVKNGFTKEIWSPAKQEYGAVSKKSFNFTRMADNVSPRKKETLEPMVKKEEIRYFNFENLISKSEILIKSPAAAECKSEPVDTAVGQPQPVSAKPKFVRPNSLPLKPGTFTPKGHHGITPTHNTMPLISPETPRPSKSCRELYFNGHAYTNIGLKSSTKPFYCTVNKTQPFYVQTQKQLSMYSNWQVHPENKPHPLGLKPVAVMSLYDSSQQRDHRYSIASQVLSLAVVNSSSFNLAVMTTVEAKTNFPVGTYSLPPMSSPGGSNTQQLTKQSISAAVGQQQQQQGYLQFGYHDKGASNDSMPARSESSERTLSGGFESTEEYTYVRGRGRGKYVCKECGIRCKKPSMLKKHIRTHTDVRPYSCQHCSFHFKTKGNLTKHMKSKSHFKKCTELGLNPIPTSVDDDGGDIDIEGDQQSISSERTSTIPGDSDSGSESDGEDSDDSDESKSRLPEHEAAHCLLSLSMTPPTSSQMTKSYPSPYGGHQQSQRHQVYGPSGSISPDLMIHGSQQLQQQHSALVDSTGQTSRRVITFANTPKVEFNLLKHEQYYSDPSINKKKRDFDGPFVDDDGAMPIDLTKKTREPASLEQQMYQQYSHHYPHLHPSHQLLNKGSNVLLHSHLPESSARSQVIVRVSDVVTPITGTANLLTTLVSNTDKIPLTHNLISSGKELVDDNVYFQEYITQRALQDSRMKQSQMKSVNNNQYEGEVVDVRSTAIMPVADAISCEAVVEPPAPPKPFANEKVYRIFNGKNEPNAQIVNSEPPSRTELLSTNSEAIPLEKESLMVETGETNVTRTDGPTESLKLDVPVDPVRSRSNSVKSNDSAKPVAIAAATGSSKESAKSVASEYLKLTKSVTLRKREDSESGTASDQEALVENKLIPAQPIVAPIVAPVVVVPTTTIPATGGELAGIVARTVVVGEDGFKSTPTQEFSSLSHFQEDGGRPVCEVCNKRFLKISQLKIHMNIHYMERKYRCEPCGTSFRSQGLFLKHERSATHKNKVSMTTTFGIATDSNPRPFYCKDCDVGFRIHGHLAKHLRSKMHVLKLECLGKLPFGTYTEIERSGTNLTEIDTTDCENSLSSLKRLAVRLNVKDPANVLPGGAIGSSAADAGPSGNETDSCDDNMYENDNDESNVEDSSSSNGPNNKGDDEDDNDGIPSGSDFNGFPPQPQLNNNILSLKRKPDESSTSNEQQATSEAKRARLQGTLITESIQGPPPPVGEA
ncbi:transcription factor HIVEP3 isoform X2 [Malaya genurostris]|nr:transcription factor HIVEP3 isoform X2 [Malaya genurostris]XP_058466198.1 transcription factor HIVEP3 isoform X2 [Malaya genurostris]